MLHRPAMLGLQAGSSASYQSMASSRDSGMHVSSLHGTATVVQLHGQTGPTPRSPALSAHVHVPLLQSISGHHVPLSYVHLSVQCDSADKNHKNLDILLGVETAVLVVDNTHTVWPQHLANLLHCTSFVYFPADVPRMGGTALLATCDTSHEQPDPMLPAAAAVLEDVHR